MTREKFQRKLYFFYEKASRFNPRLILKSCFLIRQVPFEKYELKTLFLSIQHIENRKKFYWGGGGGGGGWTLSFAQKHFSIKTY